MSERFGDETQRERELNAIAVDLEDKLKLAVGGLTDAIYGLEECKKWEGDDIHPDNYRAWVSDISYKLQKVKETLKGKEEEDNGRR